MASFIDKLPEISRESKMEITLLFFLTVEMVIVWISYLFINPVENFIYNIWMFHLLIALFLSVFCKTLNFAIYRAGFRLLHMCYNVYILYTLGYMIVPFHISLYFLFEFTYTVYGISYKQMDYPTTWIVISLQKCGSRGTGPMHNSPIYPFTSVACETIRKECILNEEKLDDSDGYYSALEDVLFPVVTPTNKLSERLIV
ncbi:Protein TEX261 [Caenorhabditis elegans]|uniref:Protein TEX261 n=1 Tax=Caenorhabditis elegans TaxID=6239 RepID=Q19116_CAEEL|nr:Protein TEX261 [Caenorhabditis elegans]CAA91937.1 Protein TEX261 [Caenorhabditis elegans]|eukprot:NP_510242.1 Uncharacterized protein CELE_F02D10.6 [Caenorhabditis elegans]